MPEKPVKRKRRSYTLEDRELGLSTLVLHGGSHRKAARALNNAGNGISDTTLFRWKSEYADRYHELEQQLRPRVEERAAARAEALILSYGDVQQHLIDRFDADELPSKEIPGALRNIATAQALQVDKVQGPLRGRPTIVEHRQSPDELLTRLARNLGIAPVDSTAVEVRTEALERPPREALESKTGRANARDRSSSD